MRDIKTMDVDGGSSSNTSPDSTHIVRTIPIHSHRHKALYQFQQQSLPACKPVLTPAWVITTFLLMGVVCVPVGLISLRTSRGVVEIVYRYDVDCVPEEFRGNKVSYIQDSSYPKKFSRFIKVHKYMKAPIYIYYQLDNYYQTIEGEFLAERILVKIPCCLLDLYHHVSKQSDQQLLHGLKYNDTSSCKPEESNNGLPIVPCGLIAWSLFNDTYTFTRGRSEFVINRKNIAWKSDRDHKFGKNVYPFNFQNGSLIGGGSLDPSIPLSDQEDLIVMMRTAALPSFRKLYGIIEEDLEADDVIVVHLMNNYNTYSFGGKKKLVLSTSSWMGGRNDFLGVPYLFIGSSSVLLAIVFLLFHVKYPRYLLAGVMGTQLIYL